MKTGRRLNINQINSALDDVTRMQARFVAGAHRNDMSRHDLEHSVWMLAVEVHRLRKLVGAQAFRDEWFDEDLDIEKWANVVRIPRQSEFERAASRLREIWRGSAT